MAKKKKASSRILKPKPVIEKPNLFESIYNKKKFDILGQKSKAALKKRGQARQEGIEKRKGTLLVEYKQRKKANSFQDRRFGEQDEGLSAEDKALARFQKQKLREIEGRKSTDFGLYEGAEELTHLGAPLEDNHDEDERFGHGQDSDYEIDPEAEASLHFGGGFEKKAIATESPPEEPRRKSKKEVMEEIMAKSKAYKAEKAKQKEEDYDAAEKLDQDLAALMQSGGLSALLRPKGQRDKTKQGDEDTAYDVARREMVFDSKAKVGERTKTEEEIAQAEVQRLETLEKERLRRMAGDEDAEPSGTEPLGGYAKKRAKRKREEDEPEGRKTATGDALEDDFDLGGGSASESEEDQESPQAGANLSLDERRQKRAAGSHPLQESFREAARQLSNKYGLLESSSEEDDEEEEDEEEDNQGEEQADTKADRHPTGSDADFQFQAPKDSGPGRPGSNSLSEASDDEPVSGDESDSAEPDQDTVNGILTTEAEKQDQKQLKQCAPEVISDLPFKIEAPQDYPQFGQLVDSRTAEELSTVIQRIRVSTNIALAEENKQRMQIFYGILVQHFAILAGRDPIPMDHLDVLTIHILELTPSVPLYAATTAIARLQRLHDRLHQRLVDGGSARPSQMHLLLLKLWSTVFPASDKRHSVLTPAMLLIGSHLSLCPISSLQDIKTGVFLAALATQMASSASRWMPEPLNFLLRGLEILLADSKPGKQSSVEESRTIFTFRREPPEDPNPRAKKRRKGVVDPKPPVDPPKLGLGVHPTNLDGHAESCAVAVLSMLQRVAEKNNSLPSLPEALTPAVQLLERFKDCQMPEAVMRHVQETLESISSAIHMAQTGRKRLQKVKVQKEVKQYNPRFEEGFVSGKDYDPDRERAERRKLKRMLTSERRGAIRELRRDASYLGEQHALEKHSEERDRKRDVRGNTAWLAKLEQDFKSGGQGGMWKKKGKKS